ncbi:MAG: hypothetical protein ABSD67_15715 [Terracidiphilus sp.]|jgi:hypothetical protein
MIEIKSHQQKVGKRSATCLSAIEIFRPLMDTRGSQSSPEIRPRLDIEGQALDA